MEVAIPGGKVYAQYVGEHPSLGGTLLLDPQIHPADANASAFDTTRAYYAFYPVRAALKAGLISIAGTASLDGRSVPRTLRRAGARAREGQVLTWIIVRDQTPQRVVEELDDSDRMLPIGWIWSHDSLIQAVLEGWRPEAEG